MKDDMIQFVMHHVLVFPCEQCAMVLWDKAVFGVG